jgi:hypothetical protein
MWRIGVFFFGIIQLFLIVAIMVRVFRKKEKVWGMTAIRVYLGHGFMAVLAIWMFIQATH